MSESVLGTALALARRGLAVLPLHWPVRCNGRTLCSCGKAECRAPAKHPYTKRAPRGLLSATDDSGIVKGWFGYQAPEANLGVVTDRLVALDVDPRHGGDESLAELERAHGALPATWRVLTGGGGHHVIFTCPAGVNVASTQARDSPLLGAGLDVRARSGYLVAPPSQHISGRPYAWSVDHHPADVPLAEPPGWLLARLAKRADQARAPVPRAAWMRIAAEPVTEYADAACARLAGHLFRRGVDSAVVLGLLLAWNTARCTPSLPPGEVRKIIDRVAALEAQRLEHADE